jgi:hypothetical protein
LLELASLVALRKIAEFARDANLLLQDLNGNAVLVFALK